MSVDWAVLERSVSWQPSPKILEVIPEVFLTSRVKLFLLQKRKQRIRVPAGAHHFFAAPAGRAPAIVVPNGGP
jgi:hypothetical protein